MNRYVAFLRGINISGKNKISMSELKAEFEAMGFSEVSTCLNRRKSDRSRDTYVIHNGSATGKNNQENK